MLMVSYLNWMISGTMTPFGLSLSLNESSMILWPQLSPQDWHNTCTHTQFSTTSAGAHECFLFCSTFPFLCILFLLPLILIFVFLSLNLNYVFNVGIISNDKANGSQSRGWDPLRGEKKILRGHEIIHKTQEQKFYAEYNSIIFQSSF